MRSDKSPRKIAIENGDTFYRNGKNCGKGHVNPLRYVSGRSCKECLFKVKETEESKKVAAKYRAEHKEDRRQYDSVYYRKNSNKIAKNRIIYYGEKSLSIQEKRELYYEINRASILEKRKEYAKNNPAKVCARAVKYRADKMQRVPSWADLDKIQEFYEEAGRKTLETGLKYQVDHIIPLRGKLVSGLHVEGNLRVILAEENHKKSNKFEIN